MATYIAQVDPEKDAVQISMEKELVDARTEKDAVEQKLVVALTEKDAIKKDLKRAQRKMKAMASKLAKKNHPDTPCENPACWLKEDELWDAERKMKAMASKSTQTRLPDVPQKKKPTPGASASSPITID